MTETQQYKVHSMDIDDAIAEAKFRGKDVSKGMSTSEIERKLERLSSDGEKIKYLRRLEEAIEDNQFCPMGGYNTWRMIRKGMVSPVTYHNLQSVLSRYLERQAVYSAKEQLETLIASPVSPPPEFRPSENHPNIGPDGKTPQDYSEGFRQWMNKIARLVESTSSSLRYINTALKEEEQTNLQETALKVSAFEKNILSRVSEELNQRGFREDNVERLLENILETERKYQIEMAMST